MPQYIKIMAAIGPHRGMFKFQCFNKRTGTKVFKNDFMVVDCYFETEDIMKLQCKLESSDHIDGDTYYYELQKLEKNNSLARRPVPTGIISIFVFSVELYSDIDNQANNFTVKLKNENYEHIITNPDHVTDLSLIKIQPTTLLISNYVFEIENIDKINKISIDNGVTWQDPKNMFYFNWGSNTPVCTNQKIAYYTNEDGKLIGTFVLHLAKSPSANQEIHISYTPKYTKCLVDGVLSLDSFNNIFNVNENSRVIDYGIEFIKEA